MSRRSLLLVFAVAALVLPPGRLAASELAIPRGYFNSSGGFFLRSPAAPACWYYTPVGGCTVDASYCPAAWQAESLADAAAATRSWYAGEVVLCGGRPVPCPGCLGPAGGPAHEGREDVGPGLVVPNVEPR